MSTMKLNSLKTQLFPGRLNTKERPLSLRERRLQSTSKLSLSISKQSTTAKHPKQMLRDGEYDLSKDHLEVVKNPDNALEIKILAFLEEENVKSVDFTHYIKDLNNYDYSKTKPKESMASCKTQDENQVRLRFCQAPTVDHVDLDEIEEDLSPELSNSKLEIKFPVSAPAAV